MFTLLATMLPVSQDVMETVWQDFKYEDDPAYKSSMQREFFYRALNVLYNCMWYSNMNFTLKYRSGMHHHKLPLIGSETSLQ